MAATCIKLCKKTDKDSQNEAALSYAILISQVKESMWIMHHYGLLPTLTTKTKQFMPDLYHIYERWINRNKNYQDKFETAHRLLTSGKPAIIGTYSARLLGKRYFQNKENISMLVMLKFFMCAKVLEASGESWPIFVGGKYAKCKPEWIDTDYPRDSVWLLRDSEDDATKVTSFFQLMLASNEGILSARAVAARLFVLKADTAKQSVEMKDLQVQWEIWWNYEKNHGKPFLELKEKEDADDKNGEKSKKARKTQHVKKAELHPLMKGVLDSIQGVHDSRGGEVEDLDESLDMLYTKYKKLASACDYKIERKPGPGVQEQDEESGSEESGSSSEIDSDDEEEDEE